VESFPLALKSQEAEVEVQLEEQIQGVDSGRIQRRITVRSSGLNVIHQTYTLPPMTHPATASRLFRAGPASITSTPSFGQNKQDLLPNLDADIALESSQMCWATFVSEPGLNNAPTNTRKYLCVLASPSELRIFDVLQQNQLHQEGHEYENNLIVPKDEEKKNEPENDASSLEEGVILSLPFDAASIKANPVMGGILLQRAVVSPDDYEAWNHHQDPPPPPPSVRHDSPFGAEEEFEILNVLPPQTKRVLKIDTYPVEEPLLYLDQHPAVPSLFSLCHFMDDIRPVVFTQSETTPPIVISDAFEMVLYIGGDPGVCVSYHTQLRRHALWTMNIAPSPPPEKQLWEIAKEAELRRQQSISNSNAYYSSPVIATGLLSQLHPHISMTCIWEEQEISPMANQTFISSGISGDPNLLCLISSAGESLNCLSLANPSNGWLFSIPCKCAVALTVIKQHDILVLSPSHELILYRENVPLVRFSLTPDASIPIKVEHPVHSRVDLLLSDNTRVRVSASMVRPYLSELSETALDVIETQGQWYWKFRTDCARLLQVIPSFVQEASDLSWMAFECLTKAVFDQVLGLVHDDDPIANSRSYSLEDIDAWEFMLKSEFHAEYSQKNGHMFDFEKDNLNQVAYQRNHESIIRSARQQMEFACLKEIPPDTLAPIFDGLHLAYEECKLAQQTRGENWMVPIGSLLASLASRIPGDSPKKFIDHYFRDLGADIVGEAISSDVEIPELQVNEKFSSFEQTPCVFSWIESVMSGLDIPPFPENPICSTTKMLVRFYSILQDKSLNLRQRDEKIVLEMVGQGIENVGDLQRSFPPGVVIPFIGAIKRCRDNPPKCKWPAAAFVLIDRQDLAMQQMNILESSLGHVSPMDRYRSTIPSGIHQSDEQLLVNEEIDLSLDADVDGLRTLELSSCMFFPRDNRVREAARLLRSSRPVMLLIKRPVEMSDHDFERLKQDRLLLLCRRSVALPFGRGMLTLGTIQPVMAEPIAIPAISLTGRMPPNNATVTLDTSTCPSDMTLWPEFHNGVAAGLRVKPCRNTDGTQVNEGLAQIIRTWIVYNKPSIDQNATSNRNSASGPPTIPASAIHAHGGLLMALGLQGYLSSLAMTDIYEYLSQGSVTTTVGVLLGMGANKRRTSDPAVSKMLCLHVPSLLPPSFAAMEVAPAAQVAAIAGLGMLYEGSSHRLMTEFLLSELGRRPTLDHTTRDRESYTLACGLALGMLNLCKGREGLDGLADLRLEERLYKFIVGGKEDSETRIRRETADRANAVAGGYGDQEQTSRVYEGENINVDVTAPGATLAFGLIFMQSGNNSAAERLKLPETSFMLDFVRPDFLMLRVIARALILWDDIQPTAEWVSSQLPSIVKKSFDKLKQLAQKRTTNVKSLADLALNDDVDEESISLAPSASEILQHDEDVDVINDRQALRQAHAFILTGGCLALGLRYAGTGNQNAALAIEEHAREFARLRKDTSRMAQVLKPEKQILEMCCASVALSLAMVMAGTGNLRAFRLLRELRWRIDEDIRYGTHMCYGAAVGLLFLGGGAITLGRTPSDVAVLLMSLFPVWPSSTSDQQYHLQPLRHLYVLATRQRAIDAIDVDTWQPVFIPLEVKEEGSQLPASKLLSPCLIPDAVHTSNLIINVSSDRYYPLTRVVTRAATDHSELVLYVKKKAGHLSFVQDPHEFRSLLVQVGGSDATTVDVVRSFTESPILLSFAEFMCSSFKGQNRMRKQKEELLGIDDVCTELLFECLSEEKPEMLFVLLAIHNLIRQKDAKLTTLDVWNIRLLQAARKTDHTHALVTEKFVASISEAVDNHFARRKYNGKTIMKYVKRYSVMGALREYEELGACLVWFRVPFPNY